jgi:2-oxo-3-hexenedioate decarboxylase
MTSTVAKSAGWALDELLAAQRERREIGRLTEGRPELDEAAAYAIQAQLVARLVADERTHVTGLKLGLTSKAKQKQMNIAEPVYGELLASRQVAEGEALRVGDLIHPKAEPEIALVLGRELKGPGVTTAQARDAIAAACVAIEIIDSRFKDYSFALPDCVADNASAARHMISTYRVPVAGLDLRTLGAVFEKNGEVVGTGAGAAVSGDPANGIAWLANKLAAMGRSLAAGTVVMTGSLCDAIALAPGDVVSVTVARLGSLTLRCS